MRARPAARRISREEQLLELRDHIHARDRRVLDALITVFSEAKLEPRVLAAVGVLVRFGGQLARQPGRRRS